MGDILNPKSEETKEQTVARLIDNELNQAALAMARAYNNIRRLVYSNKNITDPNAVYAAFEANTKIDGFTAEKLGETARITKTVINRFLPENSTKKIVDEVPEITIDLNPPTP